MSETFFVADLHLDHPGIIRHCRREFLRPGDLDGRGRWRDPETAEARTREMSEAVARSWNSVVGGKDLVYVVVDMAFRNHRRWINELRGKKVLIVGNHDKMPQDALDLFLGEAEWQARGYEEPKASVLKTMAQLREVHHLLDRVVCGQRMTLCHYPMLSWSSRVHGAWAVVGHAHGRCREACPGEAGGGLMLDVGWDLWERPLSFGELREEMGKKMLAGAFRPGRRDEDEEEDED